MITGAHAILYSANPDADRDFLRDVIGLPHVDVGHGWLIFGLPPSEIAVHPAETTGSPELYFMCDDIEAFVAGMASRAVSLRSGAQRAMGSADACDASGRRKAWRLSAEACAPRSDGREQALAK